MGAVATQATSNDVADYALFGDFTRTEAILVQAIESLYLDQIHPQQGRVIGRIQEHTSQKWGISQLRRMSDMSPHVEVIPDSLGGRNFDVLLKWPPANFRGFVDENSAEDPYPDHLWSNIDYFLQQETQRVAPAMAQWPGSRYRFAKLIQERLPSMNMYSLGQVCHIVQLCIRTKALLGYHQGNLVPYAFSDDCKKHTSAVMYQPMQLGEGDAWVQSWSEASRLLMILLQEEAGAIQLSTLKAVCQRRFQKALSESALGHTKLSELLCDPRMKGKFLVSQRGTEWWVMLSGSKDVVGNPAAQAQYQEPLPSAIPTVMSRTLASPTGTAFSRSALRAKGQAIITHLTNAADPTEASPTHSQYAQVDGHGSINGNAQDGNEQPQLPLMDHRFSELEEAFIRNRASSDPQVMNQAYEVRRTFLHMQAPKPSLRRCKSAPRQSGSSTSEGSEAAWGQHFSVLPGEKSRSVPTTPAKLNHCVIPGNDDCEKIEDGLHLGNYTLQFLVASTQW